MSSASTLERSSRKTPVSRRHRPRNLEETGRRVVACGRRWPTATSKPALRMQSAAMPAVRVSCIESSGMSVDVLVEPLELGDGFQGLSARPGPRGGEPARPIITSTPCCNRRSGSNCDHDPHQACVRAAGERGRPSIPGRTVVAAWRVEIRAPCRCMAQGRCPSTELRTWYGHQLERWPAFRARYRSELKRNKRAVAPLLAAAEAKELTLLYAARDEAHNSAVVLLEFLERSLDHGGSSRSGLPIK